MKEEFIQLDCTKCTISDDKGNLQTINSIDSLAKILEKEKKIKHINYTISGLDKSLKEVQHKEKVRKALNIFILIGGILMTLAGFSSPFAGITSSFGIIKALLPVIYVVLIMKAIGSAMYGIKILNKREIKKITKSINNHLQEIETLTKELKELKSKTNYQAIPYLKTHINPMKQSTYKYNQNKVKRLVLDNNEKN